MFAGFNISHPLRLYRTVCRLVDQPRRQRSPIRTDRSDSCYLVSRAILEGSGNLFALPLAACEDSFRAPDHTYHEALFVHIVAIVGQDLMLLYLAVQELKVELVFKV